MYLFVTLYIFLCPEIGPLSQRKVFGSSPTFSYFHQYSGFLYRRQIVFLAIPDYFLSRLSSISSKPDQYVTRNKLRLNESALCSTST